MSSISRLITVICSSVFVLGSAFGQKAAIETEVKGVDGRPSNGAEVRIERQDKKTPPMIAKADKRGRLTVTDLAVGVYTLTATVEGGIKSSQTVKTEADKSTLVAFDMRKTPAMMNKPKKRYVWVQAETGTRIGGHWVEADDDTKAGGPSGRNVETVNGSVLERQQFRPSTTGGGAR